MIGLTTFNVKTKEGMQPQIRINTGTKVSPKWESIDVGDTVRVIVKPSEYNGKTYYNSGTSQIKLIKKGKEHHPKVSNHLEMQVGIVVQAHMPRKMIHQLLQGTLVQQQQRGCLALMV